MSPPDQVVQQFKQAIGSGSANSVTALFANNLKVNIPGAQGAGAESVGGESLASSAGATTPDAANVKILDSFSAGDRVVTRFQYNVKGSDVEGGGSGSATLTALCVARLENGKVVEATIEQDTTPLLKLGAGG